MQPLSPEMQARLDKKNMPIDSPILIRVFKEEAELEVWKKDTTDNFALLKTYPICRWSGELGPKIRQGDRQAPEGFYTITPGQMNPRSNYYLAFNLGFPNAYDRANDRTGQFLMVHGDCSSAGCYAMTDAQIAEIYSLGREAFLGGQKSFQVQAYPFRMTALNMARHRNSPHMAFWRMIKEGNDHFEVTRQEPKVDVCEKHYVFDATPVSGSFVPTGRCPAYQVADEVVAGVKEKQDRDERAFAQHVAQGVHTVAVTTGNDGGMHPTFVAKLNTTETFESDGRRVATLKAGMSKPTYVYLPRNVEGDTTSAVRNGTAAPQVASADPSQASFFRGLFNSNGEQQAAVPNGADNAAPASPKPAAAATSARPTAASRTASGALRPAAAPARSEPRSQVADTSRPQQKPEAQQSTAGTTAGIPSVAAAPAVYAGGGLIPGAQPVRSSSNFDSRWGGM